MGPLGPGRTDNNTEGRRSKCLGGKKEQKVVGVDQKGSNVPLVVYSTNL